MRLFIFRVLAATIATCILSAGAVAQNVLDRPSDSRPELPAFEESRPGQILPPVRLPESDSLQAVTAGRTAYIREYRFRGNRALGDAELQALVEPFVNRQVSFSDIEKLGRLITETYIRKGYVNSGALIPDQAINEGVLQVDIIEGRLAEVTASTSGRLPLAPIRKQLLRSGDPLDVNIIEERLQLLQQDPLIATLDAQLTPGDRPGDARLNVDIEESRPWRVSMGLSNYEPAPVGEAAYQLGFRHLNVFGLGDEFLFSSTASQGLFKGDATYRLPLNSYGTSVAVRWSESHSKVVLSPFDDLDIESESSTLSLELTQAVWQKRRSSMDLFLRAESRRSYTSLLDEGFSFTAGPEQGRAKATVLRLGQDYIQRQKNQVLALRTTLSTGFDANNATVHSGDTPDAEFLSVLVQIQLARKLAAFDSQLITRLDGQWSDSALLGMEQFAMGGVRTVRGYVQNSLVADKGAVASLEWRIPVWRNGTGDSTLALAPFVDYGRGWNNDRPDPGPDALYSVGVGLLAKITSRYRAEFWYGEALEDDIAEPIGSSWQEQGVHLSFSTQWQ